MTRKITILLLTVSLSCFYVKAQNVGIGTSTPTEKLHIGGTTSTLRVEGLATGGTASGTASAATDKILWTDANGVIRSLSGGNAGYVLISNISGAPTWVSPSGLLNVDNGLYYNPIASKVYLGGNLLENTNITQGNYSMLFKLSGTGGFEVRNGGTVGDGLFVRNNDRVGIGTSNPQDKLEIGGAANTIRIGGIATGGSFLAATAATTDRMLYTNTSGQISALPNGATGTVLSMNTSGVPSWGSAADIVKVQNGLSKVTIAPNATTADPYIELGGTLLRNTTITQGNFNYVQNLNASGAFDIQDNSASVFSVDANGNVTVNDVGSSRVFRVEGLSDPNLIYTDGLNNRVGIGTATPADKLDISGTANTIRIGGVATGGSFLGAGAAATDKLLYANASGQLKGLPNGGANSVLVINGATLAPTWASPDGLYWKVRGNAGTTAPAYNTTGTITASENYAGTTDAIDYVIGTNGTQRVRVTSGGKVAIGANNLTAAPASQLYVESPNASALELRNATSLNTGVSTEMYFRTLGTYNYSAAIKTIGTSTATARMGLFTYASSSSTGLQERMSILDGGEVGIGTTTPRGIFDVAPDRDIYLVNSPIVGTTQSLFLPGHIFIAPYSGSNVSYLQARRSDNSGTTALRIRTYNAGVLTEAVHIEGTGNVGINTTAPNAKALVDMTSTNKGVLFPRLTTAQRDAMTATIPEGLHIYNTDNDCLEFFDTSADPPGGPTGGFWNSYCRWCENVYAYNANSNGNDFNAQAGYPSEARQWCVWINPGVTLGSTSASGIALNFSGLPGGSEVTVYNYGTVVGGGGRGGDGGQESDGVCAGDNGGATGNGGGTAIYTSSGVKVKVFNYGIVAGGGGGGGGGSGGCRSAGGGGGGGRGIPGGGGGAGWTTSSGWKACGGICTSCCGSPGSSGGWGGTSGAAGGGNCSFGNSGGGCFYSGYNGGCGGNGGNWGTAGAGGTGGTCGGAGAGGGGAAGYALRGSGGGSSITNKGGTYYGPVQP